MARDVEVYEVFAQEGVVLEALSEYLLVDELAWSQRLRSDACS